MEGFITRDDCTVGFIIQIEVDAIIDSSHFCGNCY
jgi:hypothetical protein